MLRTNLTFSIIVFFTFYCFGQVNLTLQKTLIDSFYQINKSKAIVLVKTTDKPNLIEITGTDFPSNLENTYNIFKNESGKIVMISECPYCENGDWMICLVHYFNKQGNTFAFERQSTFFSNVCSGGIIMEAKSEYYSDNFQLIDKSYKFYDEYGKDLTKDSCQVPVNMEYTVVKNLNEYMTKKNIKISK